MVKKNQIKSNDPEKIRYFEPVEISAAAPNSVETRRSAVNREKLATEDRQPPCLPAEFFTKKTEKANELFDLLLFYFDQIIYIKEISENLGKLEKAVAEENIDQVKFIAGECAALGANCGMFAALEPLRRLENLKNKLHLADAAGAFCTQVREEFEQFRTTIRENLEQIENLAQFENLGLRS